MIHMRWRERSIGLSHNFINYLVGLRRKYAYWRSKGYNEYHKY